jgi:hypothetical protein
MAGNLKLSQENKEHIITLKEGKTIPPELKKKQKKIQKKIQRIKKILKSDKMSYYHRCRETEMKEKLKAYDLQLQVIYNLILESYTRPTALEVADEYGVSENYIFQLWSGRRK